MRLRPALRHMWQVARHHELDDLWVVFRGGVYDLTSYAPLHPGGSKLLFDKAGRDCTRDFEVAHGAHNTRVESMLAPHLVGSVRTLPAAATPAMHAVYRAAVALLDTAWEARCCCRYGAP